MESPLPPQLEAMLEAVPEAEQPLVRAALAQWCWVAGLASALDSGAAESHPERDPGVGLALDAQRRLLEALLPEGLPTDPEPGNDLHALLGEYAGVLARIGAETLHALPARRRERPPGEAPMRDLYDLYVEEWESRYSALVVTEEFARLHGRLVNEALRLRRTGRGSP